MNYSLLLFETSERVETRKIIRTSLQLPMQALIIWWKK